MSISGKNSFLIFLLSFTLIKGWRIKFKICKIIIAFVLLWSVASLKLTDLSGNKWESLHTLEKMIQSDPTNSNLWELKAENLLACNLELSSFGDGLEAIRLDPMNYRAYEITTNSSMKLGDSIDALEYISIGIYNQYVGDKSLTPEIQDFLIKARVARNYKNELIKLQNFDISNISIKKKSKFEYLKFVMNQTYNQLIERENKIPVFNLEAIKDDDQMKIYKKMANSITKKTHFRRFYRKDDRNILAINEYVNHNRKIDQNSYEIREDLIHGGFGMYATKDIKKGEVILTERPFVSFPSDIESTRCSYCHKLLDSKQVKCDKCNEVYCSHYCKSKAYHTYHKSVCGSNYQLLETKAIQNSFTGTGRSATLLVRLIGMIENQKQNKLESKSNEEIYKTPLEFPELKILHRLTDKRNETESNHTKRTFMCNAYNKWYSSLHEYIPDLMHKNPLINYDTLLQISSIFIANNYGFSHKDSNGEIQKDPALLIMFIF